jgi:predicted DNA-binding protein (UPF0251 family)
MMEQSNVLVHYGILRRSGRYPWGSGETPHQRSKSFLDYVDSMKKQGLSDTEIARGIGELGNEKVTSSVFRAAKSIALDEKRRGDSTEALRLHDKSMSNIAAARQMGIPESSFRNLINPALSGRRDALLSTAKILQDKIDTGAYLDIGKGTSNHLGITETRLATAVAVLREKGYAYHNVQVPQATGLGKTTIKVLAPPGTKYGDIKRNMENIQTLAAFSPNKGKDWTLIEPPVNVSSKRIGIRWAEDGGGNADGVIYVRRGVPDIALGESRYAQVRIAVDGTHFLKGMAMYSDKMPDGVDLLFNTNKKRTGNKLDAMKEQASENNPFGSAIRQKHYTGKDGKQHLSPMNIVNEEGNWRDWSRSLSSQMLSKQSPQLAKKQLDFALTDKLDELDGIMKLTNPVVKHRMLLAFADSADSAAVHLKAAALPRQGNHVILPLEGIRRGEIYAPNYDNGDRVALIRHPHGGTFEIPELTVNNRNRTGRSVIGPHAPDAVGIHPDVAHLLSGADFDGDTVLVIPNNRRQVKTSAPLAGLKNFNPGESYPYYDGMKVMTNRMKQQQMGEVSNLITDMTIKGASPHELAQAIRHSMVVIDAEKHKYDYKRSYQENGIAHLKEKYQGKVNGRLRGASTIVSRAGAEIRVPQRRKRPARAGGPINPRTGQKEWEPTGATYRRPVVSKRTGEVTFKESPLTARSKRLAEEVDARRLISDANMPIERIYAAHSNSLKALANNARLESLKTGKIKYSASAAKAYAPQVARLNHALNNALKNAPLERQAQIIAKARADALINDTPGLDNDAKKKIRHQSLKAARMRVGADKDVIVIDDPRYNHTREWEAIQAGAITTHKLSQILENSDIDRVKELATPRARTVMSPSRMAIAKARLAAGYTQAEIAASLGIPVSTLESALKTEGVLR